MLMIILLHVCIALASIVFATIGVIRPSIKKVGINYGLMLATIASGTYLIISSSSNILKSCLVGLLYLTVVSVLTIATHVRLRRFAEAPAE